MHTCRYDNHPKLVARQPLLNHVLRKSQDPKLSWGSVKTSSRTLRTGGFHINGPVLLRMKQRPGINSVQHVTRISTEASLVAWAPRWKPSLNSKCLIEKLAVLSQNNLVNVVHLLALSQDREEPIRAFYARLKANA